MPYSYVLGVDGGGTWTRSVIIRLDGVVVGSGYAGPSNPITIGVEKALENIMASIAEAQEKTGVTEFKASRLGLAGATRSNMGDIIQRRLPASYGDSMIVSDVKSALSGATGCKPGVVVIAGTGSNAYGENAQGEKAMAGGWGWRLGDEGSGYTIGKNAIIAALQYHDGRAPYTELKDGIVKQLDLGSLDDIVDWTYATGREPRDFANLVPLVKQAEANGDAAAVQIMREAGAQLGVVAQAVIRRLRLEGDFPVACCGGVFRQPRWFNVAFEETVRQTAPRCRIIEPLFSPTIGSGLLALMAAGVEISEDLLENVKASLVDVVK